MEVFGFSPSAGKNTSKRLPSRATSKFGERKVSVKVIVSETKRGFPVPPYRPSLHREPPSSANQLYGRITLWKSETTLDRGPGRRRSAISHPYPETHEHNLLRYQIGWNNSHPVAIRRNDGAFSWRVVFKKLPADLIAIRCPL